MITISLTLDGQFEAGEPAAVRVAHKLYREREGLVEDLGVVQHVPGAEAGAGDDEGVLLAVLGELDVTLGDRHQAPRGS